MQKEIISNLAMQILLSILIGISVAIMAHYFVAGVLWLLALRDKQILDITLYSRTISLVPVVSMLIAAVCIICVRKALNFTRWYGPADSIHALYQSNVNGVNIKLGLASTLASFISAGGGASVGEYGPLILFGATMSTLLSRVSARFIRKDIFMACGVAAAISSGFNAPIAGILFAHEAFLRRFSVSGLSPISVAAIVAAATKTYFFDSHLAFTVPEFELNLTAVLPYIIVSSPLCSLVAILYMQALRGCQRIASSGILNFNTLIIVTALFVGIVGLFIPEVLGLGNKQINEMLLLQYSIDFLLIILVGKIVVTSLCIGFGFFGGVFGPALFIGAALGGVLSTLLIKLGLPPAYGSIIAVAALASVGAAVIGAPLTVVLIVMELTGSYQYALMALLSITICSTLSYKLYGLSFYDRQLLDRGIDLSQSREYMHISHITIKEIGYSRYLTFYESDEPKEILRLMQENKMTQAYLIDKENRLIGKINAISLAQDPDKFPDTVEKTPVLLCSNDSLTQALALIDNYVTESIPVVDNGTLVGVISEIDLLNKVFAIQERIRKEVV